MKLITKITGEDAYQQARRKARRGPYDWIGYRDKTGELTVEILNLDSLKRALLIKGTKGKFSYFTSSGQLLMGWRGGINMFYQLKHPHYDFHV